MTEFIQSVGYWVHDLGIWGYPLAVTLMAGVAILPIPAEIPAALNGMMFGPVAGVGITWTGALAGSWLSFELSRRYGRPLVERFVPVARLEGVDGAVNAGSWPALLVARLIPAIAFTALNWGLGLTLCRRRTFLWTTALGILPGTILFVYSGEGFARLYLRHPQLAAIVALLAIVAVVIWRRRWRRPARRAAARAGWQGSGRQNGS